VFRGPTVDQRASAFIGGSIENLVIRISSFVPGAP